SQHCHVLYNVSPDNSWEVYRVDRDRDPMETEVEDISDDAECKDARDKFELWYDASQIPKGAADAVVKEPPQIPGGAADAVVNEGPQIAHPVDADLGEGVHLIG